KQADEWSYGMDIFDWNSVTGGTADGTAYDDHFNRAMALIQRSLDIPEALHRQTYVLVYI
ncbi:hypothetical protein SARC_16671, partial [Sphaeroforma arctica JP610]